MDAVELKMQRKQLDAWMMARPTKLVLTRFTRQPDGAGGWTEEVPTQLQPQTFRLVVFKRRLTQFMENIDEGQVPNLSYSVVGKFNADIKLGDEFTHEGASYKITAVDPDHEVRKVAVARYEGEPSV